MPLIIEPPHDDIDNKQAQVVAKAKEKADIKVDAHQTTRTAKEQESKARKAEPVKDIQQITPIKPTPITRTTTEIGDRSKATQQKEQTDRQNKQVRPDDEAQPRPNEEGEEGWG